MLPTIEQHVEWITDCIGYMSARNYTRIEATQAAEQDWWDHVQDAAQIGLKATTDSWYVGANITGKKRCSCPIWAVSRPIAVNVPMSPAPITPVSPSPKTPAWGGA